MRTLRVLLAAAAAIVLSACFSDGTSSGDGGIGPTDPTSGNGAPPPTSTAFRALFVPAGGILPYPSDLYFSGSTDGTLNLPVTSFSANAAAINALDGFSTSSYISTRFSGALDPATLTAANIRVVKLSLDNATKAPLLPPAPGGALPQVLTFGTDYTVAIAQEAGSGNGTLVITPTRPLQASSGGLNIGYLVLLTNGIHDTSGNAADPDDNYRTVRDQAISEITAGATTPACTPITNATLNAICRLTFAHLKVGAAVGIAPTSVVQTIAFSTQSIGDTLGVVAQTVAALPPPQIVAQPLPGPSGRLNTHDISAGLQGKADVFAGTVRVPYYLSGPTAACDAAATLAQCPPIRASWTAAGPSPQPTIDQASRNLTRFNPVPGKTTDLDIPLLVLVPNANSASLGVRPSGGWPVAVFQHGLTRNRFDAIAIADAFADAGFVVVSIDLPLHGITPTSSLAPFRIPGKELIFDLDVTNNATLAPGPDGNVDGSGQNFVNLGSLLTTRDNLRQGAVDLLALTRALSTLELTGDTTPDINLARIHFVGHSLGSIVGGVYAALATNVRTASLLMTGGGVANTINDSAAFGPAIRAGLSAQSGGLLVPGTTLFNQFLRDAQTVTDAGDPINYFGVLLAAKPVHVVQVIGQPGTWLPDQVVPNSSTGRMITAGGNLIHRVSGAGPNPVAAGNGGYVNFLFGHHGSIIDPSCSTPAVGPDPARCLATTIEMQRETVTFAFLDGAAIVITDTSVVQP